MTQQYGGNYVIRAIADEPLVLQPSLRTALQAIAARRQELLLEAAGEVVKIAPEELAEAEALVDSCSTNPERETLILDLDPMSANLPPHG